jgi:poly(hydroxyalkanoate) depolymerase family esterase
LSAVSPPQSSFVEGSFTNRHGARRYKLFIPSGRAQRAAPLLVMLHGCLQDPDDFALGTRMNAIAEEHGIFVLYPEQSEAANHTRCWNWFDAAHQRRDQGEPSLIAGMTREMIRSHDIDASRVYIAGLSAGGAMAAIMAANYPDLYSAVGIHSGVPYGAVQNLPTALALMKNGATPGARLPSKHIPLIVFHGDQDLMVNPRNAAQLVSQWLGGPAHIRTQDISTAHARAKTTAARLPARVIGARVAPRWKVGWCTMPDMPGSAADPRGALRILRGPMPAARWCGFFSAASAAPAARR